MRQSFRDLAERGVRAEAKFVQSLMDLGDISEADAIAVKDLYLTNKLARIDHAIGSVSVKHGAYLDKDVIQNACNLAKDH